MPFIRLEVGKLTPEQKEKLISGLTKTASDILGIPESSFWVLLSETDPDNWGIGGKVLTKIYEERAKKQKD